jgi:hypothetical protein
MTYRHKDPSDAAIKRMQEQAAKAREAKRISSLLYARTHWDYSDLYDANMYQ